MLDWLNPRVIVVVVSVMVLLSVTRSASPEIQTHRAIVACSAMLVAYLLVFLIPLRKAVRWTFLLWMAVALLAGWAATALALVADAIQVAPDEMARHPSNWARAAFVVAAAVAFYLFFDLATRGYRAREDLRVRTGGFD